MAAGAEDGEVPSVIDVRTSDWENATWLSVGQLTELNASVTGTHGSDLTNDSWFRWHIPSESVSWMPREPNVIDIFPEAAGDFQVFVEAIFRGHNVTTSIDLTAVLTVESVILAPDPPRGLFYNGDEVRFTVTLVDWRGNPINDDTEFSWSVESGLLDGTSDDQSVAWTPKEVGWHTILVEYTHGPQLGSASYTIEVLPKLSAIEVGPVPKEVEIFSEFNLSIRVLDSTGSDMTTVVDVTLILIEGNVSDVEWSWDGNGTMNIVPVMPRDVIFLVVAELNGSVIQVPQSFRATGSLPEEEGAEYPDILEVLGPNAMVILIIMPIVIIVALVLLARIRTQHVHSRNGMEELYTRSSESRMSRRRAKMERTMRKRFAQAGIDVDVEEFKRSDDEAEDDF